MHQLGQRVIGAFVFPAPDGRDVFDAQHASHMLRVCREYRMNGEVYQIIADTDHPTKEEVKDRETAYARLLARHYHEIWIFGQYPSDVFFVVMKEVPVETKVRNCATVGSSLDHYLRIFHQLQPV